MASYNRRRLADLRQLCVDRGLDTTGRKSAIVQRLLVADADDDLAERNNEIVFHNGHTRPNDDDSGSASSVNELLSDDGNRGDNTEPMSEAIKIKQLELQIEMAKLEQCKLVNGTHPSVLQGGQLSSVRPRDIPLPSMSENGDPLAFFACFEKTLQLNGVDESIYTRLLPSHLNERAKRVFAALSYDECQDYNVVKAHIISSFKASAHSYLEKFRTVKRTGQESQKMFASRLTETYNYYLQAAEIKTFDDLKQGAVLEQFLLTLDAQTRQFVRNNSPKTAREAADFADLYYENSYRSQRVPSNNHKNAFGSQAKTQVAETQQQVTGQQSGTQTSSSGLSNSKPACFICNSQNHKQANCPFKAKGIQNVAEPFKHQFKKQKSQLGFIKSKKHKNRFSKYEIPITVDGQILTAYRDTGSALSFVQSGLLPNVKITGKVEIFGINDRDAVSVPTASVKVNSPFFGTNRELVVEVGLLDHMKWQFLLGNQFFEDNNLRDIIQVADRRPEQINGHPVRSDRPQSDDSLGDGIDASNKQSVMQTPTDPNEVTIGSTARAHRQCSAERVPGVLENAQQLNVISSGGGGSTHVDQSNAPATSDLGGPPPRLETDSDLLGGNIDTLNRRVSETSARQPNEVTENCVTHVHASEGSTGYNRTQTESTDFNSKLTDADTDQTHNEFIRLAGLFADSDHVQGLSDNVRSTGHNAQQFKRAQQSDPTLAHWRRLATAGSNVFVLSGGLLFKRKPPNADSDNEFLLCLPVSYRQQVLHTAHDSLHSGGHTSFRRTLMKIRRNFAFPQDFTTVQRYCRSCEVCARKRPVHAKDKAKLHPIPVIGNFADSWNCDVLGPSLKPTARRKNKYILVCVDSATRYTQLFALRNLKADTLADIFTNQLFARFGLPKQLVYDQQTALTSHLFQNVLQFLNVDSKIALAGYHTRTGLAERQIRTVSDMLKGFIHDPEFAKNWDTNLNHIAFNINQLPCKTLGYSAHQLIFGRNLRCEIEALRDEFLGMDSPDKAVHKNVLKFVEDLQSRLLTANDLAKKHAAAEQTKTCAWYDRKAKSKTFEPGDYCIVLVPDDERKLFARWSEPTQIIRRVSETSYEVELQGKRVVKHVNCLRPFTPRQISAAVTLADEDCQPCDDGLPLIDWDCANEDISKFHIGTHLTEQQQSEMRNLLQEFPDVFTSKLGCTTLLQHDIELTDETPCVSRPYKLAQSLEKPVQKEINRLLDCGVIRESTSDFCSPMVPVRKKNSDEIRITVNFSRVNEKMKDIKFPMTNPTDLLAKVAGKKYVTTMDLKQSFFQIQLTERSKKYTAFWAGNRALEFNRSAMGLKTSPAILQKLMTKVLCGTEDFTGCLLDDVTIFSDTWKGHLKHVREVLERLRAASLTLNVAKCQFCLRSMQILGYTLMDGQITPSDEKIEAILKLGPAKTKKGSKQYSV